MARTATVPERLPFTADDEANRLIAADPAALHLGNSVRGLMPAELIAVEDS